jgi:hypothetical protein
MLASIACHYLLFPYDRATRSLQNMTQLIHMTPLSLSVAYDESTFNHTYPEMQGLGRMDFIYEK